jgi:hypothetical protein
MNKKAVILWIVLSCLISNAYADEDKNADDNRFDGSEFKASSFQDTDFAKPDYKELRRTGAPIGPYGKLIEAEVSKENKPMRKPKDERGIAPAGGGGESNRPEKGKSSLAEDEKLPPITDLPSDWVPDAVHLTSNGGFSTAPFNGSPVPYTLNGHPEIERGRP